jgi:septal ring factor EnvC (AmiA/AmiB activator)
MPLDPDEVHRFANEVAIGDRPPTAELALDFANYLARRQLAHEDDHKLEEELRTAERDADDAEKRVTAAKDRIKELEEHIDQLKAHLHVHQDAIDAAREVLGVRFVEALNKAPLTVLAKRPG